MSGFVLTYPNLKSWAERLQVPYRWNDELGQLAVGCRILDTDVPLLFIPRTERGMVTLAVTLPFTVPPERFAATSEALTLLNARSYMGAWILNTETREIYFRVTVPALEVTYTDVSVRFVASLVVTSAEAMARPLHAVVAEGASPDTIAQARV